MFKKDMFTCIIGGFLGSGKTTAIMRIAAKCRNANMTVAILVNEMGEVGVDGATMKAQGYDAIELPDGCICCSLSGSLQTALKNIDRDIHPDILIIEPTGLALPHKVKEFVHISLIDSDRTVIVGIADAHRFNELIEAKADFFARQLHASDFIVVNKCDTVPKEKLDSIIERIDDMFTGIDVIPASAAKDNGMNEVYRRIMT